MKIYSVITLIKLTVIVCVDGISIDSQLTVIRNDCYERMAIGEKLSPKQTYKTFDHNTVSKCESECTKEGETCRAYSFGIGPKGNATCMLSHNPVKETGDLKPIGTISDTDYDLYIKKLDCHIIVEHPQTGPQTPAATPVLNILQHHQNGYGVQEHHHGHYENLPAQSNYHSSVSTSQQGAGQGYHYDKPGPPQEDGLHHVQTLVSIASGPQSVLHPVHDILISQDSYGSGDSALGGHQPGDVPPFRPPALNHPYEDQRHHESNYRPDPFLTQFEYEHGYNDQGSKYPSEIHSRPKPYPNDDRPNPDYDPSPPKIPDYRYGTGGTQFMVDRRKYQSFESEVHRYGAGHSKLYEPHYNFYDQYDKPNVNYPSRYGSVIPHPDDYHHSDNRYDYLFVRPNSEPTSDPDRPDYGRPRPEYDPHLRPRPRPLRPDGGNQRPLNDDDQGYDKPSRPNQQWNSTRGDTSTSRPPSTELSNHYGGVDVNKQHGKPGEYHNDKGDGGDRKIVTQSVGYNGERITSIITELPNGKLFTNSCMKILYCREKPIGMPVCLHHYLSKIKIKRWYNDDEGCNIYYNNGRPIVALMHNECPESSIIFKRFRSFV